MAEEHAQEPQVSTAPARSANVWARIKEHKIAQWTLAYAAAAYALLDGTKILSEAFDWPHWLLRAVAALLVLGLPLMVTLAWYHGHRALRRVSGAELTIITVLLVMACAVLWHFAHAPQEAVSSTTTAQTHAIAAIPVVPISDKSIAVLPFLDLSEKQDQQYFADGLAEEILDELAQIPDLKVIGRTSSFQFHGKPEDVRSIGASLGAAYVVEGSVRRTADHVRVTAQLISTDDGSHRWSNTYDASVKDIFKVQDSIAADLARSLDVTVTDAETQRHMMRPEAYELFLKAKQLFAQSSQESVGKAIALFQDAAKLDPTSSRIQSALAYAYGDQGLYGWSPPAVASAMTQTHAEEALKLDAGNAQAHEALALKAIVFDWDWSRAAEESRTALQLGPRSSGALVAAGHLASTLADWGSAERFFQEALAKDPLYADAEFNLGAWVYLRTGEYEKAEQHIRRGLQIRPRWGAGHYYLSIALLMQGKQEAALAEAQNETPPDGKYQASAVALFALHRRKESDDALQKAISENQTDWPSSIAKVYAFRGQFDEALKWLERAYAFRDSDLYFIKGDPHFRKMEQNPRFKAFLHKMKLPE